MQLCGDMFQQRIIPAFLLLLCSLPVCARAESPRPLRSEGPIVVLLPQIEELEDSARMSENGRLATSSASGKQTANESFPSPRQFWKRFRMGHPKQTVEQSVSETSGAKREIVTASDLRLDPIPESALPPRGQRPLRTIELPPENVRGLSPSPSTEMIVPENPTPIVPGVMPVEQSSCDSLTQAISPRSHKLGSRLRFPHLSNLFHK